MNNKAPEKKRIFIVDDHAMFRDGLQQLIDREADLTVCGDAADAAGALEGISRTNPDLVIVDISLSGKSGIDLIKSIKDQYEDLPVLVVSMHEESLYAERALRAGAMGYVMKQEPAKVVKVAIRKVLAGNMHLSEKMAGSVITKFMHGTNYEPQSPLEKLSDREGNEALATEWDQVVAFHSDHSSDHFAGAHVAHRGAGLQPAMQVAALNLGQITVNEDFVELVAAGRFPSTQDHGAVPGLRLVLGPLRLRGDHDGPSPHHGGGIVMAAISAAPHTKPQSMPARKMTRPAITTPRG